ncbi:unnamed protein product [Rotaria sordida]|uniref:SWIM-type domain-containing protein n=1 Tax=Rotaria sordida TaxID=392033 RepID=A0A815V2P7_9BILA|nr:unnamed protein product [Rotaria sordida]CAF1524427.1 unnamed protein product [Rotaria sordida]
MAIECVCCNTRIDSKNYRPFRGIAMRLFVSARTNMYLPDSGSICNACRMSYLKWRNNTEFISVLNRLEEEPNESIMDIDDKNDDDNNESVIAAPSNDAVGTNVVTLPLNISVSSHHRCVVCREDMNSTCTVPDEDRDLLFMQSNIFIPKGSRCCPDHVVDGRLINDDLNKIRPREIMQISFSSTDILTWLDKFRDHYNSIRYFDFDPPFSMSESDCYNLTGISKGNFEHLIKLLVDSNIKNSSNRSFRNAVGLFLTKLRLGISNKVLTTIFQFSNPKAVSRTLAAVRQAMLTHFVPYYLGFNHISRQEVIDNHSSPLATQLLTDKPNTVVLVIDAAYGPYLSDNSNNDAAIQKDILIKNKDGILNWIAEHDLAVVDRGFRDSTGMMRALDLDVCMPDFLNGRHRFDALEANRSCFISKIRWVVESANGRVKHFKWLNQTIQNTTIPQIRDYLQIACALINAYRAPAISSFSNDDQIATKMLAHLHEPNLLRTRLNNEVLRWSKNDASNLVGFPILTIDQIRLITVGIFQLKQARAYSEEHCSTTDLNNQADFPLQTCNTDGQLIRIRFQSRHSNAKSYYTYIQFSTEEVLNSCCDCPIGDRQVGVCAHRAAAIWFLAYQRHQNDISRNQPSGSYLRLLDDSELIDDFVESSDEDDLLYSLS